MNTTLKVAKLELNTLFYSPIAWLILIVFTFQTGLSFTENLGYLIRNQNMGYPAGMLTENIFSMPPMGILSSVQANLYLYIPLLTMGLISRELSSGTIKLLFSSPVRLGELVMGKFLAMAAYGVVLIVILSIFVAVGCLHIPYLELKLIVSGLLGLYLLICTYSAIGLFMSSLTPYQVVAAISTLVVLAALRYVGNLGQEFDILRDITYYLSISGRSDEFISGLISSKDLFYFLIIIAFFLVLTIFKLRSGRETRPLAYTVGRYSGLVLMMTVFIYVSSRHVLTFYIDMTANKRRTLTENSQQLVRQLDGPVKMTTYVNLLDENGALGLPNNRLNDLKNFENYIRFLPNMDISYVYYYDNAENLWLYEYNPDKTEEQLAEMTAEAYGLNIKKFMPPAEISKQIDLSEEENRLVRMFEFNNKRAFVRMFNDMMVYPSEQEITAALKTLVEPSPKVLFLTGHFERRIFQKGDSDYQMIARQNNFRNALINQGFQVDTLRLDEKSVIPQDISALVIADPRKPFSAAEITVIKNYLDLGGNLFIAAEFNERAITLPLLDLLGISPVKGMLAQQSEDFDPQFILASFDNPQEKNAHILKDFFIPNAKISFNGASALHYRDAAGFVHYPLLVADSVNTWNRLSSTKQDSVEFRYDPGLGDEKAPWPIAIASVRKINGKEQRIFVAGDADFLSNAELSRMNVPTANLVFSTLVFRWFSEGAFPIDTSRPATMDNEILMGKQHLFWVKIFLLGLIPVSVAVFGAIFLYRRRIR